MIPVYYRRKGFHNCLKATYDNRVYSWRSVDDGNSLVGKQYKTDKWIELSTVDSAIFVDTRRSIKAIVYDLVYYLSFDQTLTDELIHSNKSATPTSPIIKQWTDDMMRLPDGDITLIGTNGSIPANAAILRVRSVVFAKMLDGRWNESSTDHISLPFSKQALELFYGYIKLAQLPSADSIKTIYQVKDLARQYLFEALEAEMDRRLQEKALLFGPAWKITVHVPQTDPAYDIAITTIVNHAQTKCSITGCNCKTFDASRYQEIASYILARCFAINGITYNPTAENHGY